MIEAILIDDELDSLDTLDLELKEYCPEVNVIAQCSKAKEGLNAIIKHKPDLVFLDIEMPLMNGFELLKSLDEINFDVIFVTAYDQFAVRAFEFNAVDYLLKPVLKSKLIQAVDKVIERKSTRMNRANLDALINNISVQVGTGIRNIALPTTEGFEFVQSDTIHHVKSESNYCWVHLENGTKYLLAKTLKQIELLVRGPQFFRSHQSYLVNLNYAKRYVRGQGGYIVMTNGMQIPVSRAKKEELIGKLRG